MNSMDSLPDELLLQIFRFLPISDVLECERVCERWSRLASDSLLWNHLPVTYSEQAAYPYQDLLVGSRSNLTRHLKLSYATVAASIIDAVQSCNRLVKLELVMCRVPVELVDVLRLMPDLILLHIKNCTPERRKVYNFQFDVLGKLTSLRLTDFGLYHNTFHTVLKCEHLTEILIDKIKAVEIADINSLVDARKDIIRVLHIYGGDSVDDSTMPIIGQCVLLQDLAIIHCDNLTDRGLRSLKTLVHLKHLKLWNNSNFREDCLLEVLSNPHFFLLQLLSFSKVKNISNAVLNVISSKYKKLKFLAVYQCVPRTVEYDQ